eukprot:scaffold1958_cov34-Tisochrysis_lutea.AAC.1
MSANSDGPATQLVLRVSASQGVESTRSHLVGRLELPLLVVTSRDGRKLRPRASEPSGVLWARL